jgi:anti-sigma regulatory factor (Ser/Thr protein kinase)
VAPRLNLALAASINAPRRARHAIVELLARSGRTDLAADAALLVSELVTNAVVHAGGPVKVSASYVDHILRVEVADTNKAPLPNLKEPSAPYGAGVGLRIVALLADRWAVEPTPDGKTVWFEMS